MLAGGLLRKQSLKCLSLASVSRRCASHRLSVLFCQENVNQYENRAVVSTGSFLFERRQYSTEYETNLGQPKQPQPLAPLPSPPPPRGFTCLSNRALIAIGGPGSAQFLNGIVTSKIVGGDEEDFNDMNAIFTSFLNSKGRMIADGFLYPIHNNTYLQDVINPLLPTIKQHKIAVDGVTAEYLVDIDSEMAASLLQAFKLYKLRSPVSIVQVPKEKLSMWAVWDDTAVAEVYPLDDHSNSELYVLDKYNFGSYADNRSPGMGLRMILPSGQTPLDCLSTGFINAFPKLEEASLESYHVRRILYGIPEGPEELPSTKALPLESCIDYMGGINFNKGCYVGQELTIRSHHHGIVRKRIIPVVFYPSSTQIDDTEIELSYDPLSPVATNIDTKTCLVGSSIVDLTQRESSAESPFASSPFASKASSRPSKSRPIGSIISAVGNIGLALVRLEEFAAPDARPAVNIPNSQNNEQHYICVRGFQPFWWPQPEE